MTIIATLHHPRCAILSLYLCLGKNILIIFRVRRILCFPPEMEMFDVNHSYNKNNNSYQNQELLCLKRLETLYQKRPLEDLGFFWYCSYFVAYQNVHSKFYKIIFKIKMMIFCRKTLQKISNKEYLSNLVLPSEVDVLYAYHYYSKNSSKNIYGEKT